MFYDNKSVIDIVKSSIYHTIIGQISIKPHFIRDATEDGEVQMKFCNVEEQVVDIFTRELLRKKFNYFREKLGIQDATLLRRIY